MFHFRHMSWLLFTVFVLSIAGEGLAQRWRGGQGYGDWRVTIEFEGGEMESILALSRDADGNRTGQWISFWGVNDLSEVNLENGDLTFDMSYEGFDQQKHRATFSGRIDEGVLTGTFSGDRGEATVKGNRVSWQPRAVGSWELKFRIGDRDITTILKVSSDADRNLAGEWVSDWGEHEITDLSVERNQLTFNRSSTFGERELSSAFTGTVERDVLTGTISSEMGEVTVAGTRLGANAVGTWVLELESERGPRKQRLRINRDLSAFFGASQIAEVTLDGDQILFPVTLESGDRSVEMSFEGTLSGTTLTGELTTPQGTLGASGTKIERPRRNRPST